MCVFPYDECRGLRSTVRIMDNYNRILKKPLTDAELQVLADEILYEDLPVDNLPVTNIESSDDDDFDTSTHPLEDSCFDAAFQKAIKNIRTSASDLGAESSGNIDSGSLSTQVDVTETENSRSLRSSTIVAQNIDDISSTQDQITAFQTEQEPNRKWEKRDRVTHVPDYTFSSGVVNSEFESCQTATEVFIKLLGTVIQDITYQSNLYATQNKTLKLEENKLLAFIDLNFLMAYHRLPNWKHYWNSSPDLEIPLVSNTMPRNRFEMILSNLHCNDNGSIPADNKNKLYKIRPMIKTLNQNFQTAYQTTRQISIDESVILFKGRTTLKQYNPQKPIKRGYKIWCSADQKGYISKFDIYPGKNENLETEFAEHGLGERVVLSLSKDDWNKQKIVYFDNYFTTIGLLEKLRLENTLGCGTIRSNRRGFPKYLQADKSLSRGEYDYRFSNTNIGIFKWKDTRIVHLAPISMAMKNVK